MDMANNKPCACKDRLADECPGQWEPDYDLGNNEKYAVGGKSNKRNTMNEIPLTITAAKTLFDNRLGWSDGRQPYAPRELWADLGAALYGEDDSRVKELRAPVKLSRAALIQSEIEFKAVKILRELCAINRSDKESGVAGYEKGSPVDRLWRAAEKLLSAAPEAKL
jgi:hypothetical protein